MARSNPKASHSFEGCKTCRRRHLKCDQTLPNCKRCQLSGLSCGYKPVLRWLVTTGADASGMGAPRSPDGNSRYSRRHLYTEYSRRSMSSTLVADVPSGITAAINEVEEESKNSGLQAPSGSFAVGPFGVFKAEAPTCEDDAVAVYNETFSSPAETRCRSDSIEATISTSPGTSISLPMPPCQNESRVEEDECRLVTNDATSRADGGSMSEAIDELFASSLDLLQWGDLFTWDTEILGRASGSIPYNSLDYTNDDNQTRMDLVSENATDWPAMEHGSNVTSDTDAVAWPEVNMETEAPLLLRHFNEEVIDQMGSLPINEKSGWRILNFPSAILTLGQLTMMGMDETTIRRANLANFFGLLAVSAYHLSLNSTNLPALARPGDHWKNLSARTYAAAKYHLKLSLETESDPTSAHKAKYKEQLMAIGAVLATALLSGNETDSHRYLLKMERLIRVRGLTKPKLSRRARLFHNIYAWMRIVSESTRVHQGEGHSSVAQPLVAPAVVPSFSENIGMSIGELRRCKLPTATTQNTNPDITLDSFLHLEPLPSSAEPARDPANDMDDEDVATPVSRLRDIHLVSSLDEQEDLYMQIYGVPETWLRLVSQITRLANVMNRLSPKQSDADARTLASLQPKAAYLEEAVCSFRSRYQSAAPAAPNQVLRPHIHMARALSPALVIFFYRCIRDIHPMLLQESVGQVLESLRAFDAALEQHGLLGPGTAWPAFIAGAEAMQSTQRHQFQAWLNKAFSKSGWKGYGVSREVLNEVWGQRDESGGLGSYPTWIDVCRQTRKWPLLC